jgi:hypothetical protein
MAWNEPQIWDDTAHAEITPATQSVAIQLGRNFGQINVYDPMIGSTPIATTSGSIDQRPADY